MPNDHIITYKELENIYTACVSTAIEVALSSVWAEEELGPFGKFEAADKKNVEKANKNRKDGSKVNGITANCHSFDSFDFQACNRTLFYLGEVYKEVYAYYNISPESGKITTALSGKMLTGRNILAHLNPKTDADKIKQVENELLEYINSVFALVFNNIADKNGIPYAERFKKDYHAYQTQQMLTWAKLDDYLDRRKYDFSRFPDVCVANNIKIKMEDGFYWFCTSDVYSTVAILKNNLSYKKIGEKAPQQKPNSVLPFVVFGIIAVVIIFSVIFISLFSGIVKNLFDRKPTPTATVQITPTTPLKPSATHALTLDTTASPESTSESIPAGENQILPEHEGEISALKYSDGLTLSTKTVTVKEGGLASLPCALAWSNIEIYSENTAIAVGEGSLIRGVKKGTTFVIAQSQYGTTASYRIIVE